VSGRPAHLAATALATLVAAAACSGPAPRLGRSSAAGAPAPRAGASLAAGEEIVWGEEFDPEEEEIAHEDPDALGDLIAGLLRPGPADAGDGPEPGTPPPPPGGIAVPVAKDTWNLSDEQCLALLGEAGIATRAPDFPTPAVRTPLLLEGPIEGVAIRPRWPQKTRPVNTVMDCRLIVALVAVAREASHAGFGEVLFYSTYRPLEPPPEKCEEGQAGAACRKAKRRYERALAGPSQHRRALAIDIHSFRRPDGTEVTLLEHYERHDGQPPCADEPRTEEGRFLKELACALHRRKVFHVVLTPNSNQAHHNHFHFDITPNAGWYIVK
jgi:hypothetical protein